MLLVQHEACRSVHRSAGTTMSDINIKKPFFNHRTWHSVWLKAPWESLRPALGSRSGASIVETTVRTWNTPVIASVIWFRFSSGVFSAPISPRSGQPGWTWVVLVLACATLVDCSEYGVHRNEISSRWGLFGFISSNFDLTRDLQLDTRRPCHCDIVRLPDSVQYIPA